MLAKHIFCCAVTASEPREAWKVRICGWAPQPSNSPNNLDYPTCQSNAVCTLRVQITWITGLNENKANCMSWFHLAWGGNWRISRINDMDQAWDQRWISIKVRQTRRKGKLRPFDDLYQREGTINYTLHYVTQRDTAKPQSALFRNAPLLPSLSASMRWV